MSRFARTASVVLLMLAAAAATVSAQPPRPGQGQGSTATGATCNTDGSSANIAFSTEGTNRVITTNFCPNHAVRTINPNDARENSHFGITDQRYPMPLAPTLAPAAQQINLTCIPSAVGFARSGAVFFSVFPGTCGSDAVKLEGNTFDECGGHAEMTGMYHYHMTPSCTHSTHATTGQHSPLMGYMVDGIPIYGPLGASGNVPTDLDACGGHASDGGNGGNYHYHLKPVTGSWPDPATPLTDTSTVGAGYPYTPGCLAGCVPDTFLTTLRSSGVTEQTSYASCVSAGTAQPEAESVSGTTTGATPASTTTTTTTTTAAPVVASPSSSTSSPASALTVLAPAVIAVVAVIASLV